MVGPSSSGDDGARLRVHDLDPVIVRVGTCRFVGSLLELLERTGLGCRAGAKIGKCELSDGLGRTRPCSPVAGDEFVEVLLLVDVSYGEELVICAGGSMAFAVDASALRT